MKDEETMYKLVCSTRFDKMEVKMDEHQKDMGAIKRKIFNGYENRFNNMDKKLEEFKTANIKSHDEIRKSIDGMNKFIRGALLSMIGLLLSLMIAAGVDFATTYHHNRANLKVEHTIEKDIHSEINTP